MAKLERKNVKIFASNPNDATQVSAFLTGKNETPDYSSDPDVIQNTYYPKGWLGEGENDLPQVTDMNGVMYAESYKTAYLYQQGIADWIVTQEYSENSFCQVEGVLYKSLVDNNIGNDPTIDDGTNWLEISLEPYTGENIGTGEGLYKQKTIDNKLQFKTLAVTGNGNISSSGDVVTIAIGGGGTGDVYWGAIDGTLSNQSDLQQALNLKQNLIGYTPENTANKVTTIRTDDVANNTAYPTELATRTAINSAITSANTYTDNALTNLATDAFVLYANSWTDVDTGTLITTAPTGNGTEYHFTDIWDDDVEEIANFSFITTSETRLNDTFTYDVLIPIRHANINNWYLVATLTISHPDVNSGNETIIFDYVDPNVITINGEANYQFKQDLINISELVYPIGSTINLKVMVEALPNSGDASPYNLDLLLYDSTNPLVVSRNRGINRFDVTAYKTLARGFYESQECFNYYINNSLSSKQNTIQDVSFSSNTTQIKQEPNTSKTSFLGTDSKPYNYAYIDQIGDNLTPTTNTYSTNITSTNIKTTNITSDNYKNKIIYLGTLTPFINLNFGSTYDYSSGSNTEMPILNITSLYDSNYNTQTEILPQNTSNPNNKTHVCNIGSSTQRFGSGYFANLNTTGNITTPTLYAQSIEPTSGNTTVTIENPRIGTIRSVTNGGTISIVNKVEISGGELKILNGKGIRFGYSYLDFLDDNEYSVGNGSRKAKAIFSYSYQGASDIRNKENINPYNENVLDKIDKITPITYTLKNGDKNDVKIGISAQELQEQEPLCVKSTETKGGDSSLTIDLMELIVFNMKAIKELNEKVKTLEARIEELEGNKEEELKK